MENTSLSVTCKDTHIIQEILILPAYTNPHGNLYGGQLLYFIDNAASLVAHKATRSTIVTASMDNMNFLKPFHLNDMLRIECYLSGTGNRSCEVFVKVIGENYQTGHRYVGATSFLTFVATPQPNELFIMPTLIPESEEERIICSGYKKRQQLRHPQREEDKRLQEHLTNALKK